MKVLLGISLLAACCFGASNFVKKKADSVDDLLRIQERLRKMALATNRTGDNAKIDQQIESLLGGAKSPDDLTKVALVARIIAYPQQAEHAKFDLVFDRAFWVCVKKISSVGGDVSRSALDEIEGKAGLMGHEKTMFQEIRSRIK